MRTGTTRFYHSRLETIMNHSFLSRSTRIGVAIASAMLAGAASAKNTILVTTTDGGSGVSGECALADAISAHNSKTAVGGCSAGSGNDEIDFSFTGTVFIQNTLEATSGTLTVLGPITIDGGGKLRVMKVDPGVSVELIKVTIAHGVSPDTNHFAGEGGGILVDSGKLTVTDGTFSENRATSTGGGIFTNSHLTVTNSSFSRNSAALGGGIHSSASLEVDHSTFFENEAEEASGGIDLLPIGKQTATIANSTFSGNRAGEGGGIYNWGDPGGDLESLSITNSTFSSNTASKSGGAIANTGDLFITNSTFSSNTASESGGAIANGPDSEPGSGDLFVADSTFSFNSAFGGGGGIHNSGHTATVTNSTFVGDYGFDISNDTSLTVTNSTILGIYGGIANNASASAAIKGTILVELLAEESPNISCSGRITNEGYNISNDGSCRFGTSTGANGRTLGDNISTPELAPGGVQHNGGPTQTIALLPGTPAVGAIPYASCTDQSSPPMPITTDQRGYYRPVGKPCDIGAFQRNGIFPIINEIDITRIIFGNLNLNPGVGQCPANGGFVGTFSFTAELTNESDSTLSDLGVQVARLTGGNFLQTGNATAGGKNAYQTIPVTLAPSARTDELSTISPTLAPGARTQVPFTVCLEQVKPFELSIDVLGTSSQAIPARPGRRSFEFRLDPLEACRDDDPKHEGECND